MLGQLRASGFVRARGQGDIRDINSNSDKWGVVKACLAAGLYPNLARLEREREGGPQLRTQRENKVRLHPGAVLATDRSPRALASLPTDWLLYDEMTRVGRAAYVRGLTCVSPLAVALFCGPARLPGPGSEVDGAGVGNIYLEESSDSEEEEVGAGAAAATLSLDSWTTFRCSHEVSAQVSQLRQKWSSLWLRRLAASVKQARGQEEQDDAVVASLAAVLQLEEEVMP